MYASVKWINDYLDPPADADEQAELLTRAGFPLEGRDDVDDDICQDFEMTSNRGDCVCHFGLAREIAAISGRELKTPETKLPKRTAAASDHVKVRNDETQSCPLYTARVVRGITVAPSPDWLAARLRAIGQIPRNNIVDLTNFILFELGQPTHVFDLNKLAEQTIIIRRAKKDEPFLPIGEGAHSVKLTADDLVIADANEAVAMAGVKGGAPTAVTKSTTDIVIEAATFDPVGVRNSSRRHNIASDSSYRFERGVHPAQINAAADRLAALIVELAGGELCDGVVSDGIDIPQPRTVAMRPARCRQIMGVDISDDDMINWLTRLGFQPQKSGDTLTCTVPIHRLDITREVDLIEEVSRMFGHDRIPIGDTIQIRIAAPQPTELARRAIKDTLVGLGYVESITHSLITEQHAQAFLQDGKDVLRVDDERAKATPILRPSILPSLLHVRAINRDGGVEQLKLFELASTFVREGNTHDETIKLALLADVKDPADGLRPLRGVADRLLTLLCGPEIAIEVKPTETQPWMSDAATVSVDDQTIGYIGLLAPTVAQKFDLDQLMLAGELQLEPLFTDYPPVTEAHALPSQPAIERDISAVLSEDVSWQQVRDVIHKLDLDELEAIEFVTTFRGKQIGSGKKSLTLRLRFRSASRTLTHDEVDPQTNAAMRVLVDQLGAEIRQ